MRGRHSTHLNKCTYDRCHRRWLLVGYLFFARIAAFDQGAETVVELFHVTNEDILRWATLREDFIARGNAPKKDVPTKMIGTKEVPFYTISNTRR